MCIEDIFVQIQYVGVQSSSFASDNQNLVWAPHIQVFSVI